MPIREYRCLQGHTHEVLLRGQPPTDRACATCVRRAQLVEFSRPWTPTADFKKAEARAKYKAGAQDART